VSFCVRVINALSGDDQNGTAVFGLPRAELDGLLAFEHQ